MGVCGLTQFIGPPPPLQGGPLPSCHRVYLPILATFNKFCQHLPNFANICQFLPTFDNFYQPTFGILSFLGSQKFSFSGWSSPGLLLNCQGLSLLTLPWQSPELLSQGASPSRSSIPPMFPLPSSPRCSPLRLHGHGPG